MSVQSKTSRKGPLGRIGELLQDGRADCLKELGELIIEYDRINVLIYDLKRGVHRLQSPGSLEQFDRAYSRIQGSVGADFERISAEFLAAEWPRFQPEVCDEYQVALAKAVSAFTAELVSLYAKYGSSE